MVYIWSVMVLHTKQQQQIETKIKIYMRSCEPKNAI